MLTRAYFVAVVYGLAVGPAFAGSPEEGAPPPAASEALASSGAAAGQDRTSPRQDPAHPVTQPPYPPQSAAAREEGAVILEFVVREDGTVDPARIGISESSGHPALDAAAMSEAVVWRFLPATEGGKPIAAPHQFRVVFKTLSMQPFDAMMPSTPDIFKDNYRASARPPDHPYQITQPPYPDAARDAGQEGEVTLQFIVEADGFVDPGSITVKNSSGFPLLDQAAIREAATNWRFRPATLHGQPVAASHSFRVVFSLKN